MAWQREAIYPRSARGARVPELFESVDIEPSVLRFIVLPLRCWLRRVPSALRSVDMPLVVLPVPLVLLFIESLRIVPSALRLLDMPPVVLPVVLPLVLLFIESLRIVPSALRLLIVPDVLPEPIVSRLVVDGVVSRLGTPEVLLLVVVLPVLLVLLVLLLLLMPDELVVERSVAWFWLPRVSGCLVVPGVPGAPGTLD